MYDIKWIRENRDTFDRGLARRGFKETSSNALFELDDARRAAIAKAQATQERRNALSKEIGKAMGAKDAALADSLKAEVAALKELQPALEAEEKAAREALDSRLAAIPNTPHDDVPEGADEHGNVEKSVHGQKPEAAGGRLFGQNFAPKEHFELGEALGQMDFETAAKLSGSRFVVLNAGVARLSRAIGQFMLDMHTEEHGYTEVNPPLMVRDDAMFGTAQLPKFRDDQFAATSSVPTRAMAHSLDEMRARTAELQKKAELLESVNFPEIGFEVALADNNPPQVGDPVTVVSIKDVFSEFKWANRQLADHVARDVEELAARSNKFWLIPTAEVPLTNLVRESILSEEELPRRYTALTPCFRAEAGSAGRDTRGMLRQHQFEKVELVSITTPDKSREEHERMLSCAEAVLKALDLHYRVMTLCTGDMGFASQKTWDIEVWLPGQKTYREISSCSVCGDFQARRMNARYKTKDGKGPFFVHTLNGSGTAVGRALIAVMENYQNADGSISVPEVLVPYMRGVTRIGKA